jgi:hypothetical protein
MFNPSGPFVAPFPQSPYRQIKIEPQNSNSNRYLNFSADTAGCYYWRMGWQELHINMNNLGESHTLQKMILSKDFYQDLKVVKLQRQASTPQKEFFKFLKSIQPECGFKIIYEVDDVVFHEEIPDYNVYKSAFASDEIRQNCVDMMRMADEVTVTCKYMRDLFIEKIGRNHVSVIPNFPPEWWIGPHYNYNKIVQNFEKNRQKPRILYSGSGAHFDVMNATGQQDDFSHVIKFIIDNRHKYQFIFIGAFPPPLQPYIQNREIEYHPWQSLMNYPKFIAGLNPQLLLAPLLDIPFNRSKSDIKYIEGAALGIPCMCQDMVTYQDAPDFLKFNNSEDLAEKVETILNWKNRSKYFKLIPELRKLGESRFLERPENIGAFMEALNTEYNSPDRRYMRFWNE